MIFKIIWGHNLNEVVFGFNNLLSVLTDQLPVLEAVITSEMVRIHLNALHTVRKNFIEVESSDRLFHRLHLCHNESKQRIGKSKE